MSLTLAASPAPVMNRRLLIATGVIVLHVAVLWALQTGLMRRAVEIIVPGEILSEFISPPAPPAPRPQTPAPQPLKQEARPLAKPTPTPPLPA
ncbi:MAG: energy transducer TonB, partial [Curvibacter sp.]